MPTHYRILAVVPTHDRHDFLNEVQATLATQTRQADEIIFTGNVGPGVHSDDPLVVRLNKAIEGSCCNAYFILCDDDLLDPQFIAKTADLMESTGVDIVYTNALLFGNRGGVWETRAWTQDNIDDNTIPPVTGLCTKDIWRRAGGYQDTPFFDWDFWWRCFYSGAKALKVNEPLFHYRFHPGQEGARLDWNLCRNSMLARINKFKAKMKEDNVDARLSSLSSYFVQGAS